MKRLPAYIFWLFVLGGVVNYYITTTKVTREAKAQLKEAYAHYVKGEKATTIGERRDAFNQALSLYTDLETKCDTKFGTGKLYYNIANSYFQLGEYSWATLYYYRAIGLRPRNEKIEQNLDVTLNKLGVVKKKDVSVFKKIFFFHHYLSPPERLQLFFVFAIVGVLSSSFYIWIGQGWQKRVGVVATILSLAILLSLGYSHYLTPIEGVIVRSTALYRDAGEHYAKVIEEPVLSGNKVEVLDVLQGGRWLKVMTPEGNLGYIPQEAIRVI